MTTDTLKDIKAVAKRLARVRRIQHIAALEIAAVALGQPHWRGLTEAAKKGWSPTPDQLEGLQSLLADYSSESASAGTAGPVSELSAFGDGLVFTRWVPNDVVPMEAHEIHGELDGQSFYIGGDEFEIAIGSQGWEIQLDQPPSAKPVLKRLGGRVKSVDALDPPFVERATQLLKIRARRMHAEVASAWPRRSTMADHAGRAQHPLGRGLAAEWHCLHCDGVHDGAEPVALPELRGDAHRHLRRAFLERGQTFGLMQVPASTTFAGAGVRRSLGCVPPVRSLLMPRCAEAQALQGVTPRFAAAPTALPWVGFRFR